MREKESLKNLEKNFCASDNFLEEVTTLEKKALQQIRVIDRCYRFCNGIKCIEDNNNSGIQYFNCISDMIVNRLLAAKHATQAILGKTHCKQTQKVLSLVIDSIDELFAWIEYLRFHKRQNETNQSTEDIMRVIEP